MENLPKKIVSIKGSNASVTKKICKFGYILNEETNESVYVPITLPYDNIMYRSLKSFDIVDDSRDFVNGFKVVQTANKEYAYIREEDNTLLPYRYDIATDFNEYGYAMVGKNDRVSWIDRNFRYFDAYKEMFLDERESNYNFNGFLGVSDFSKGEHPLSRVYCDGNENEVSYFGTDGKIKEFYKFDGEKIREDYLSKKFSYYSTTFDDKGYAMAKSCNNICDIILLSSGYYLSTEDLIKMCEENGFLDTINNRIGKMEQAYYRFLRDVEENTISLADNLSKINNLETEYKIARIELKQEELKSRYGEYVYERANEEDNDFIRDKSFKYASRKLAYLIKDEIAVSQVIELDLFRSLLAKRGISSYIDYEENVFHYNTNKHVKAKKRGTC